MQYFTNAWGVRKLFSTTVSYKMQHTELWVLTLSLTATESIGSQSLTDCSFPDPVFNSTTKQILCMQCKSCSLLIGGCWHDVLRWLTSSLSDSSTFNDMSHVVGGSSRPGMRTYTQTTQRCLFPFFTNSFDYIRNCATVKAFPVHPILL